MLARVPGRRDGSDRLVRRGMKFGRMQAQRGPREEALPTIATFEGALQLVHTADVDGDIGGEFGRFGTPGYRTFVEESAVH